LNKIFFYFFTPVIAKQLIIISNFNTKLPSFLKLVIIRRPRSATHLNVALCIQQILQQFRILHSHFIESLHLRKLARVNMSAHVVVADDDDDGDGNNDDVK
jgi:hypothetical protein